MIDPRTQVVEKLADIYPYKGTELYANFVQLLGLIERSYDEDLRTVSVEKLGFKQGASAQVRVLYDNLIRGEHGDIPKV